VTQDLTAWQGYKFNIFYPDLLNPTEAPKYFFEDDPNGSRDTMILRFNAGPPYEDIAFRWLPDPLPVPNGCFGKLETHYATNSMYWKRLEKQHSCPVKGGARWCAQEAACHGGCLVC
jgi:hypothetical protein